MVSFNKQKFGNTLRTLRKRMNYTQEEFANKLNVSQNTISNWENGLREPDSIDVLLNIAEALNVSVDSLVNDEDMIDESKDRSFASVREALCFILEQPMVAAFGGYDLNTMSDEEIMDLADDIKMMIEVATRKYRK